MTSEQRAYHKAWRDANPQKCKNHQLKSRKGITLDQYRELFTKQQGLCAICKVFQDDLSRAFDVDHDHTCCPGEKSCGKCVRGLLCGKCNKALGLLGDDLKIIESLLSYVKRAA